MRALALANLGIAEFWAGDFDAALEQLQAAAGLALEFGNDYVLFVAESYLAAVRRAAGQARRRAQPGAHRDPAGRAARVGGRRRTSRIAYVTLATVHLWWNELDEAERAGDLALEAVGRSAEPLLAPVVAQIRAKHPRPFAATP